MDTRWECPHGMWMEEIPHATLVGVNVVAVTRHTNALVLVGDNHKTYVFAHDQECCESVTLEDVVGELVDLVGVIAVCEQRRSKDPPPLNADTGGLYGGYATHTWSFDELATVRGSVTLRWFGQSNGYYSETSALFRLELMD